MANGGRSDADLEKFITSEWPLSRLRALVDLIEVEGATAHEAGIELGCSREAIIGKARRMDLTFRRAPGQRGVTRRVAPPPAPPAPMTPPPPQPRGSSEPMTIILKTRGGA